MLITQQIEGRITDLVTAWTQHAPESKFSGMTLAEFQTAVAPSLAIRTEMRNRRNDVAGYISTRKEADTATRDAMSRVVAGVVADAAYGANSGLYRAMKYIPKNEQHRGRSRKAAVPAQTPAPTA